MPYPNTLVFIDIPTDDVDAANTFYSEVFNWEGERTPRSWTPGVIKSISGSTSLMPNVTMTLTSWWATSLSPGIGRSSRIAPGAVAGDTYAIQLCKVLKNAFRDCSTASCPARILG